MEDKFLNSKQRQSIEIKDADDYRLRIKSAYAEWEINGFTEEWINAFKNKWYPEYDALRLIDLLRAKRRLTEKQYAKKEMKIIKDFEYASIMLEKIEILVEAEDKALSKAGIGEDTVEYICPFCGEKIFTFRNDQVEPYHGFTCRKIVGDSILSGIKSKDKYYMNT